MAFAVIAGMAVVISAGACLLLGQLGRMSDELSSRDIPRLTASLQLENQSTGLSAEAPALLASDTGTTLLERSKSMVELQRTARAKLEEIADLGGDKTVVAAMSETVGNIDQMIARLGSAAKERMDAAAQREERYELLLKTHAAFVEVAMPAIVGVQAQVKATLSMASPANGEISAATSTVDQLSSVIADSNLLAAHLMAAISASTAEALESVKQQFRPVQARLKVNLGTVGENGAASKMKEVALNLMSLGVGKAGVFEVRQKELDASDYGQLVLDETRKFNIGLAVSVKKLVDDVHAETDAASLRARQKILFATTLMTGLGVLTIVGSILFVWLYVGRNILRRIGGIQNVMQRLSDGHLEAEIEYASAEDEVGIMAKSLRVFRDSMIRARSLSTEQDLDRAAKAERTGRIEARITTFEEAIRKVVDGLTTSANMMQIAARRMSESADQSNALIHSVASAAEEASINVQTVSSNTEQLSSSISEISLQVATSTEITNRAVAQANSTDAAMQRLTDGASRISAVVNLIQSIASQTNLLALNATIEAARAGDAGKGFAVVASEVKMLADQTAQATDQVRPQIAEIQQVTASAVDAIRAIGSTIGNINEVATAIAAAVEQQGASTHEIVRNIQYAAGGTREVSTHIIGVSRASEDARSAAVSVLEASNELRRESQLLRSEIDAFLVSIRES